MDGNNDTGSFLFLGGNPDLRSTDCFFLALDAFSLQLQSPKGKERKAPLDVSVIQGISLYVFVIFTFLAVS
jgi:hypothetical protein